MLSHTRFIHVVEKHFKINDKNAISNLFKIVTHFLNIGLSLHYDSQETAAVGNNVFIN